MSGSKWGLRLLANKPIFVDGIPIYSPTLEQIADIGEEEYNKYLQIAALTRESIKSEVPDDVSDFELLLSVVMSDMSIMLLHKMAMTFFTGLDFDVSEFDKRPVLKSTVPIDNDKGKIFIIDNNNYQKFVKALMFANGIKVEDNEFDDDLDDSVKEFLRKSKMYEKAYAEERAKLNPVSLKDMVSTVANMDGNGLNIINIWQINKYTLFEQLTRGSAKEEYKRNFEFVLAGADSKKITLEHYLKQLDI